jgi:hypothetical protein
MKHILIPIQVFETGDRVHCSQGLATIIHDEMEDFDQEYASALSCSLESPCVEKARQATLMRSGVIMRLDKPTAQHPNVDEDFVEGRDHLVLIGHC